MYEGTGWMDEKLTISYLDEIIKRDIFGNKRLSVCVTSLHES